MSATTKGVTPYYYVPAPSRHPVMTSIGLFFVILAQASGSTAMAGGRTRCCSACCGQSSCCASGFGEAAGEAEAGMLSDRVDVSHRWSMAWFIFSEVMFFAAFFGALYWARTQSVPSLGSLENALLWPDFKGIWPSSGAGATGSPAGIVEPFQTMGPWPLPTINTGLLLTSGVTLTIAHHALIANQRAKAIGWMWITVLLGTVFLFCQGYEYAHAYSELNLKLSSGIYGSTFYMLTGFHGFHVFVGTIMLLVMTIRLMKGHFTPERHFGFEGAAWYWHFVDVVWLGLYFIVYWM